MKLINKMIDKIHLFVTLLSGIFLLIIGSCVAKKDHKNTVYIDIYGEYKDRMTVKFDGDIIYQSNKKSNGLTEVTRGPIVLNADKVELFYQIDDKDTSFTFSLKQTNYFSIGYSDVHHVFQFGIYDSTHFFNSKVD